MAKLNEELKSKLVFALRERQHDTQQNDKQIIISTTHENIYREYSFHVNTAESDPIEVEKLKEEAKNILTMSIDRALNEPPKIYPATKRARDILEKFSGLEFMMDRIISAIILVNMFIEYGTTKESPEYWMEVKQELEKL